MKENQDYCVGKALSIYKTDKNTSIEIYKLVCRQVKFNILSRFSKRIKSNLFNNALSFNETLYINYYIILADLANLY